MAQDQTKKEALFNEVKGSLFEFLVARTLASKAGDESGFLRSLDHNYLNVLSQQDRMVRQFYPEMLTFLNEVSKEAVESLSAYFAVPLTSPKLTGKFINSGLGGELHEADLLVAAGEKTVPVSLKLNKRNAFVNTKSGGIRSFFTQYFPFVPASTQEGFNRLVDLEFARMAVELHALNEMEFPGNFNQWVKAGKSELPGELEPAERQVLKGYYARLAREMHNILTAAQAQDPGAFGSALAPLMGFGNERILQLVCFHDFKASNKAQVQIHEFKEIAEMLSRAVVLPFSETSSVELQVGNWNLQIRIKPMNKFTTTAIKINCSVKVS